MVKAASATGTGRIEAEGVSFAILQKRTASQHESGEKPAELTTRKSYLYQKEPE